MHFLFQDPLRAIASDRPNTLPKPWPLTSSQLQSQIEQNILSGFAPGEEGTYYNLFYTVYAWTNMVSGCFDVAVIAWGVSVAALLYPVPLHNVSTSVCVCVSVSYTCLIDPPNVLSGCVPSLPSSLLLLT